MPSPSLLYSHTNERGAEEKHERAKTVRELDISLLATTAITMAKNLFPHDQLMQEEYIDMDISSATFLCYTVSSPLHPREFEFQMSTHLPERETITSPADELFYKGKLLPLHLPPRLQMVQKLLQNTTNTPRADPLDIPEGNMLTSTTNTAATTPFESCNISPATSCYVSGELNPDEYFSECSGEHIQPGSKKSWSKKFKLMKQSPLALKLKASRAYLKSLFRISGCSDESCTIGKTMECSNGQTKRLKKKPSGQIQMSLADTGTNNTLEEDYGYRRSFSGVIKWHSASKISSVTSSFSSSSSSSHFSSMNPSGLNVPQVQKKSSRVNSEIENSIQGAIAYCKKSQQSVLSARKSVGDVGFRSLSTSRISAASENKENPGLFRGCRDKD